MISADSVHANFGPRTVKWSYWPRSEFIVKLGCSEQAWHRRQEFIKAGVTPTPYFLNGVKVAEQFRLSKKTWRDVWKDKAIPLHPYDVKHGEGKVLE